MLCLSNFVTCRKRYYNQSGGGYISALEQCKKMKFRTYLHLTLITKCLCCYDLIDFLVCSTGLYIWSIYL